MELHKVWRGNYKSWNLVSFAYSYSDVRLRWPTSTSAHMQKHEFEGEIETCVHRPIACVHACIVESHTRSLCEINQPCKTRCQFKTPSCNHLRIHRFVLFQHFKMWQTTNMSSHLQLISSPGVLCALEKPGKKEKNHCGKSFYPHLKWFWTCNNLPYRENAWSSYFLHLGKIFIFCSIFI